MDFKIFSTGSKQGNCYLLGNILIDCGITFNDLCSYMSYDFEKVEAMLVTHEHKDHTKGLEAFSKKTSVPIYTSNGTAEAMKLSAFKQLKAHEKTTIADNLIMPLASEHDASEPLNFLIRKQGINGDILFITDTKFISYKFTNIAYLIIECNYDIKILKNNQKYSDKLKKRIIESHLSLDSCVNFINSLNKSKLKGVYLIHLSDSNSDPEEFKSFLKQETGINCNICKKNSTFDIT